jgi:hypothetical protein
MARTKAMSDKKTCPVCGKPEVEKYAPFCSKRCADVDRIPTDEPPDGGGWPPDGEEDE